MPQTRSSSLQRFLLIERDAVRCAQAPQPTAAPTAKPEEGIPITDATVQKACGSCHQPDDKGQMSRISFQRNTPEGWQTIIQRMAALNGLNIDPATARQVVKYLSNNLGLAPEEAKPAAWEVERRLIDFKYTANADAESTCNKCHSLGRVISQRRTQERVGPADRDASRLVSARRQPGVPPRRARRRAIRRADGRPPDTRHPVEKAVDHLAQDVPAEDAGVGGVVGEHAAGAARRHVGAQRLGARQGRDLRPRHDHGRSRRRRTSSRPTTTLSRRAHRRDGHAHRPGDRLHRLPVARPLVDAGAPTRRCAK